MPNIYFGIFFDEEVGGLLPDPISHPHVTLHYQGNASMPRKKLDELAKRFGKKVKVKVTEYAFNRYNEGLQVSIIDDNGIEHPGFHITVGINRDAGGKPVNTRYLWESKKEGLPEDWEVIMRRPFNVLIPNGRYGAFGFSKGNPATVTFSLDELYERAKN